MSKKLDYRKFAQYVIEKWQAKIMELGITDTKTLYNSFDLEIRSNANGDVNKIVFTYMWYGRMVDMGVGKGITLNDIGTSKRKQKSWYTPVFRKEVAILAKLEAKNMVNKANKIIISEIENL